MGSEDIPGKVDSAKSFAELSDLTNSLIGFIDKPDVTADELNQINDKVMEFFKLVDKVNSFELDEESKLHLYNTVNTFHKTVKKKYNEIKGKKLMADSKTTNVNKGGAEDSNVNAEINALKSILNEFMRRDQTGNYKNNVQYGKKDDKKVVEMFNKNNMFCDTSDDDYFIRHEVNNGRTTGYKLHVNVSKEDVLRFLEDAIPLLGNNTSFKIWKPSLLDEQIGSQQGKLLTIYAESRSEAIELISKLSSVLEEYKPEQLPPYEKRLTPYITYRYAEFFGEALHNPWNEKEAIEDDAGRQGTQGARWARGLEEKPRLLSRSDVEDGKGKIGDIVALKLAEGYTPAELVNYNPKAKLVYLAPLVGSQAGKIIEADLGNISKTPNEKSELLNVLYKLLNEGAINLRSRDDIINGNFRIGDLVAIKIDEGYVPAVIIKKLEHVNIIVRPLSGDKEDRFINDEARAISRTPAEKLGLWIEKR